MTRDSFNAPFKGHSAKTNNESSAVSPPLQTDREKPQRVQEAQWDFCYFCSEQKCWQEEQWNYISYSWSGTGPQSKKGNVLFKVTYWKEDEENRKLELYYVNKLLSC